MNKASRDFIAAFKAAGVELSGKIRQLLPAAVLGPVNGRVRSERQLQQAAEIASSKLMKASRKFIQGPTLLDSVVLGQKQASSQVGFRFGGVNMRLVQSLSRDLARALAIASESPQPYVRETLRKAQAIKARREGVTFSLPAVSDDISRSLVSSALRETNWRQASKRLLEDLGLQKGDRIVYLSGRSLEAKDYADMVVRTRTLEALNQAKAAEFVEHGYLYIQTSAHAGVDPQDICYFMQGKVWALAPNPLGIPLLPPEYGLPPWHPNAVLEGSSFLAYGGITRAVSAKYDGPAITLHAGGHRLTIGPNHPMFTALGMKNAEFLKVGDQLVFDSRVVDGSFGDGGADLKPYFDKVHLVEDAFAALKLRSRLARIPAASGYFHGDEVFCKGEVEVVFPKSLLLNEVQTFGLENFRECGFDRADMELGHFARNSPFEQGRNRILLSSSGGVGRSDSGIFGDGHFKLLKLEKVERVHFKGRAFDFSTPNSLYCSGGFVVSNCRHTYSAWQPKFEKAGAVERVIEGHENDAEKLEAWGGKTYKPKGDPE